MSCSWFAALVAYLAAEEPERMPRDRRSVMPVSQQTGQAQGWPECRDGQRTAPVTPR